ncbi:MAG: UDP-N-acetylmuramoyl-L-alanyl-D-glutamate--2,6-diaminopimelate ligase [Desulfovibrio sp.]|jgi:UDP-N-acetylmuramoyl-L-alanyl-D-glutamate--2,6-diaminopimelate ligase|nr:UDP-N-acetylmuramoyl-L-alanyl-D-glutamate--2,6-diaminopimelate ligase [Desulfovibrio sp.]
MTVEISLDALCERVRRERIPVVAHSADAVAGCVYAVLPPALPSDKARSSPGGERFLAEALPAGPSAILCAPEHLTLLEHCAAEHGALQANPAASVPRRTGQSAGAPPAVVLAADPRAALGRLACALYDTDRQCPEVVGITGTNGKTTTSLLLECLLRAQGCAVGVIGTISRRWPGYEEESSLTTPDCLTLHSMLARMRDAGVRYALMEVSSHALDQQRVAGVPFTTALLTNLTQDHLDYHADMEDYFLAKEKLFLPPERGGTPSADKRKAANADDPYGRRLLDSFPDALGFGLGENTTGRPDENLLRGRVLSMNREGLLLSVRHAGREWTLSSPLVGDFNAMNLLAAQAAGLAMGMTAKEFAALSAFTGAPGRLERVPNGRALHLFVDYAHTPDALTKVLSALRAAGFARVVTVFGCGGNRDRTKRPLMGAAVAALSDVAVLTSDNPRDEDPEAVMDDVLPGLAGCPRVIREADRKKAVILALDLLGRNDALLVAGKGHEPYQLIRGVKYPFSDRAVLAEAAR